MKNKSFEVKIYHSSFCKYEIDAESEEEAILKARLLRINQNELLSNLENWEEADEANLIESEKGSK
jgi:hypothetical protein